MVQTRTRYISVVRALLRREGLRVRTGTSACFGERVAELDLAPDLRAEIAPILRLLVSLNRQIKAATTGIAGIARKDQTVQRLCTVTGVGPITAASFVATVDRADRFRGAHQLEAYLGLTPREMSSGEKQRRGRITKVGNSRTRYLLVEAAWAVFRAKDPDVAPLRDWAHKLAARRGRGIAAVALARKLAGVLFAMMRDGTTFEPAKWADVGRVRTVRATP
jgi:transposase